MCVHITGGSDDRLSILQGLHLACADPAAYLATEEAPFAFFVQERLKEGNKPGAGFPPGCRLARVVASGALDIDVYFVHYWMDVDDRDFRGKNTHSHTFALIYIYFP